MTRHHPEIALSRGDRRTPYIICQICILAFYLCSCLSADKLVFSLAFTSFRLELAGIPCLAWPAYVTISQFSHRPACGQARQCNLKAFVILPLLNHRFRAVPNRIICRIYISCRSPGIISTSQNLDARLLFPPASRAHFTLDQRVVNSWLSG